MKLKIVSYFFILVIDSYTSSVKLYDIGSNSNEKIIFKSTKKNRHSSNKENNNSEIKMINSIVQYNNIISKRNLENLTRNLEKEFQQVEKGKTALEDNLLKESTQDNIKLNTSSNKSDTTIYYSTLIENMIKNCYSQVNHLLFIRITLIFSYLKIEKKVACVKK